MVTRRSSSGHSLSSGAAGSSSCRRWSPPRRSMFRRARTAAAQEGAQLLAHHPLAHQVGDGDLVEAVHPDGQAHRGGDAHEGEQPGPAGKAQDQPRPALVEAALGEPGPGGGVAHPALELLVGAGDGAVEAALGAVGVVDEDPVGPVDVDVLHGGIGDELLDGPAQATHGLHGLDQALLVLGAEDRPPGGSCAPWPDPAASCRSGPGSAGGDRRGRGGPDRQPHRPGGACPGTPTPRRGCVGPGRRARPHSAPSAPHPSAHRLEPVSRCNRSSAMSGSSPAEGSPSAMAAPTGTPGEASSAARRRAERHSDERRSPRTPRPWAVTALAPRGSSGSVPMTEAAPVLRASSSGVQFPSPTTRRWTGRDGLGRPAARIAAAGDRPGSSVGRPTRTRTGAATKSSSAAESGSSRPTSISTSASRLARTWSKPARVRVTSAAPTCLGSTGATTADTWDASGELLGVLPDIISGDLVAPGGGQAEQARLDEEPEVADQVSAGRVGLDDENPPVSRPGRSQREHAGGHTRRVPGRSEGEGGHAPRPIDRQADPLGGRRAGHRRGQCVGHDHRHGGRVVGRAPRPVDGEHAPLPHHAAKPLGVPWVVAVGIGAGDVQDHLDPVAGTDRGRGAPGALELDGHDRLTGLGPGPLAEMRLGQHGAGDQRGVRRAADDPLPSRRGIIRSPDSAEMRSTVRSSAAMATPVRHRAGDHQHRLAVPGPAEHECEQRGTAGGHHDQHQRPQRPTLPGRRRLHTRPVQRRRHVRCR